MLLDLPPELVRRILQLAAPSDCHLADYWPRQQTLYNLCLVCRSLREVAQPLLAEALWADFDEDEDIEALNSDCGEGKKVCDVVKTLWATLSHDDTPSPVERLSACRNLRSLTLRGDFDWLDLASSCPNLENLILYQCSTDTASRPGQVPVFPTLVSLSITNSILSPEDLAFLTLRTSFPALRTFGYSSCDLLPPDDNSTVPYLPWHRSLEAFVIEYNERIEYDMAAVQHPDSNILVVHSLISGNDLHFLPTNLQVAVLYKLNGAQADAFLANFSRILFRLSPSSDTPCPLRTLILPLHLHRHLNDASRAKFAALQQWCLQRSVTILWDDEPAQPVHVFPSSLVPPVFLHHRRAQRAQKDAQ
ncbi:hypothetical protein JCM10207_004736 [Rhodosporidiobolus poonsookiae]